MPARHLQLRRGHVDTNHAATLPYQRCRHVTVAAGAAAKVQHTGRKRDVLPFNGSGGQMYSKKVPTSRLCNTTAAERRSPLPSLHRKLSSTY